MPSFCYHFIEDDKHSCTAAGTDQHFTFLTANPVSRVGPVSEMPQILSKICSLTPTAQK